MYNFRQDWNLITMITNDQRRSSFIALVTRVLGNLAQIFPNGPHPNASFAKIVQNAINEYRPYHRENWPQDPCYDNYRELTDYQTRELLLGKIDGYLQITDALSRGRQPDLNVFRPSEMELNAMRNNGTLDAFNTLKRTIQNLFITINYQWLNFTIYEESLAHITQDELTYTRCVIYVRLWTYLSGRTLTPNSLRLKACKQSPWLKFKTECKPQ